MVKYCAILLFVSFSLLVKSQPSVDTSITINTFTFTSHIFTSEGAGSPKQTLDSLDQIVFQGSGLSNALEAKSNVFIKNYGPGTLSTPALRGASPAQTALVWNGVLINSPMNGQLDLSLLPVQFFDDISIHYGSSSAIWGSGAVGGALKLSNNLEKTPKLTAGMFVDYASIGNTQGGFHFATGQNQFKFKLSAYRESSKNEFEYENPYTGIVETQIHSQRNSNAIYGSSAFTTIDNNWMVQGDFWYQDVERNIPPTLLQDTSTARQFDNSIRAMLSAKKLTKNPVELKYAFLNEYINFEDPSLEIASPSRAKTHITQISYTNIWNLKNQAKFGLNSNFSSIDGENYPDSVSTLSRIAVFAGNQTQFNENWRFNFLIRQELFEGDFMPFSGFISSVYQFKKHYRFQMSFSRSYRIPTMNDLYWVPGGNPDLEGEFGPSVNVSLNAMNFKAKQFSFDWSNSLYWRRNKNEIVWVNQGSYWSPQNLKNVVAYGWESTLNLTRKAPNSSQAFRFQSAYVNASNTVAANSNDNSVGNQLIYTPHWIMNGELRYQRKKMWLYFRQNFVSKRYYSRDNNYWLDAYTLSSAGFGCNKALGSQNFSMAFHIHNIFNTNYQTVAQKSMPLRYYKFQINYLIHKK